MTLRPIIWSVDLRAEPPVYEILFRAEVDSDHRVARVPFVRPLNSSIPEQQALFAARREVDQLSAKRIQELARAAELIDRDALALEKRSRDARVKR